MRLGVEQLEGIAGAVSLLGLEEVVERGHFFLELDVLLARVLLQLHLLVEHGLLVTQIAHRVDETLQSHL